MQGFDGSFGRRAEDAIDDAFKNADGAEALLQIDNGRAAHAWPQDGQGDVGSG